jgi:Rieske Fe-S protein
MKIEGAEGLMPGAALYFNYPTRKDQAVLIRAQDGEFFAYGRKCAHRGCSVDFDEGRGCLTCPCHHGAYDARTGFVLFGPPPRPLDVIILQMRAGGQLWAVGKSIGNANANA